MEDKRARGRATRERIRRFLARRLKRGDPPTVREIGAAVGLQSPATVQKHLRVLQLAGIVEHGDRGRSRAWRLVAGEGDGAEESGIPVVGRIAAGAPIESAEFDGGRLPLEPEAFAASGEVVALRVEGESMVEAGILPGDHAIIRRQPRVENGEVGAVDIDGEGTLKRWRVRGGGRSGPRLQLLPANRLFPPIEVGRGSSVEVFGKLVGVVRLYR